jgi:hypothetical protein
MIRTKWYHRRQGYEGLLPAGAGRSLVLPPEYPRLGQDRAARMIAGWSEAARCSASSAGGPPAARAAGAGPAAGGILASGLTPAIAAPQAAERMNGQDNACG